MSNALAFDTVFNRVFGNEGGYVNHPDDPGGETNWGISKRAYPRLDIKNLTRNQARSIYLEDYWERGQMEKYPPAIAFQVFDAAVNHGIGNAIRILQRAVGVADDGLVGPQTLAALGRMSVTDVLMRFVAYRIKFWTKLSTWHAFGKGWANRAADDLLYAAEDS